MNERYEQDGKTYILRPAKIRNRCTGCAFRSESENGMIACKMADAGGFECVNPGGIWKPVIRASGAIGTKE